MQKSKKTPIRPSHEEAHRLALLLADAPIDPAVPLSPPTYLTSPLLLAAHRIWTDITKHLETAGLLAKADKYALAALCVYMAEFVAANEDVLRSGYSVLVKTVSGDKMPRENPSVSRRDTAFKFMMQLSPCFGLTPRHMCELVGMQKTTGYGPSRFDGPTKARAARTVPPSGADPWSDLDEPVIRQ